MTQSKIIGSTSRRRRGRRGALSLLALSFCACLGFGFTAQSQAAGPFSPEEEAVIASVNGYLRTLSTMSGKFTQIGPNGGISRGEFAIRRPGRIRIEFTPPNPLLVVADGYNVYTKDEVNDKTIDLIPLLATPLYVFLREDVNLRKAGVIAQVKTTPETFELTTVDPDGDLQGETTLVFTKEPMQLNKWTVVDALGQRVQMILHDVEVGGQLRNDLFVAPEAYNRSRNRTFD